MALIKNNFFLKNFSPIKTTKFNLLGCASFDSNSRAYWNVDIDIKNCVFKRINSLKSGNGGIILVENFETQMKIKDTLFYDCSCDNNGGAIFFDSNFLSSSCTIEKVCAYNCYTTPNNSYQFGLIRVKKSFENKITIRDLSLSKCGNQSQGYCSLDLGYGNISVSNTNSSNNYNIERSIFGIYLPEIFEVIFSNFKNNKDLDGKNLLLEISTNKSTISFSNFIENDSPSNGVVFIDEYGYCVISHCVFNLNNNVLFNGFKGTLEISQNYIYHFEEKYIGIITLFNNFHTLTSTLEINNFKTVLCFDPIPLKIENENSNFFKTMFKSVPFLL